MSRGCKTVCDLPDGGAIIPGDKLVACRNDEDQVLVDPTTDTNTLYTVYCENGVCGIYYLNEDGTRGDLVPNSHQWDQYRVASETNADTGEICLYNTDPVSGMIVGAALMCYTPQDACELIDSIDVSTDQPTALNFGDSFFTLDKDGCIFKQYKLPDAPEIDCGDLQTGEPLICYDDEVRLIGLASIGGCPVNMPALRGNVADCNTIPEGERADVCIDCDGQIIVHQPPTDECCACFSSESFVGGGGACFQITANPTTNNIVVFRGRDFQFIRGTGSNNFDQNGLGLRTITITNTSACPQLALVKMKGMANRSLGTPNVGMGFVFMVSETLNELLPTDTIGNALDIALFSPSNVSFVSLDTVNNFDVPQFGEDLNDNYSATTSSTALWKTMLDPGQSKTIYGQWWATFALDPSANGSGTGVIYGHGSMGFEVEYHEGGTLVSTNQL